MSTTLFGSRGAARRVDELYVRSRWTDETASTLLGTLLVVGIFLPTSVDGVLRPIADVGIALLATATNGLMLLHWRRWLSALDIVLACGGLAALLLATATSPFYGTFTLGLAPYLSALFFMLLVRPPRQFTERSHRSLDRAVTIASWILVTWGFGVVAARSIPQQVAIRFYPAFYQDLVRFMVIEVRHPVGPFGTHSAAAFWYFLLFLVAYRRWLTLRRLSSLALSLCLLLLVIELRSLSALFLGVLGLVVLLAPWLAFAPPREHLARHRWRRWLATCWSFGVVILLMSAGTIASYARSIFGVQFGGFSGRYSISSGRIFRTVEFIRHHPFRPIGITTSSDLAFGDSGLVEFYLRGGPLLVVCVYGLWGLLLRGAGFQGRLWWVLMGGLLAFDVGFTALTLARLQLVLVPILLALRSAGAPQPSPSSTITT